MSRSWQVIVFQQNGPGPLVHHGFLFVSYEPSHMNPKINVIWVGAICWQSLSFLVAWTHAKPWKKASGDDQLPMLNHWQEQEEEIDEKPKDEDEVVFMGGEKESANIG